MLTAEQDTLIEKQQYFTLRNIYGFYNSNRQLLELSKLKTLRERRQAATLKFAQKTAANERFAHWFKKRTIKSRRSVPEEFVEQPARTDRRKNSPLYHYRRLLNDHRVEYDVRKIK